MKISTYIMAVAAAALASAPALAAPANPAASLSISKPVRASGSSKHDKLAGTGVIIALVAAAAVVAGIVVVATDNSDSK